MPAIRRVRKVANPRRRKTASSRRKMSAKQIKYFGTKRQRAALKSASRRKRPATGSRSKNPALVLTLGAVNPRKRSTKKMARRKTTRRSVSRRRTTSARRRNPIRRRRRVSTRRATARRNPPRRRRVYRRRRNPGMFGTGQSASAMTQSIIGGLVGVAAAKFIPAAIPINLGGGNVIRTLISGLSAFLAGWAGTKAVNKTFGDAVLFGGLMQTASVALNAFLPAVGRQFALTGMGALVDTGGFVLPSNPVMAPMAVQARVGASGLDRSFGRAF